MLSIEAYIEPNYLNHRKRLFGLLYGWHGHIRSYAPSVCSTIASSNIHWALWWMHLAANEDLMAADCIQSFLDRWQWQFRRLRAALRNCPSKLPVEYADWMRSASLAPVGLFTKVNNFCLIDYCISGVFRVSLSTHGDKDKKSFHIAQYYRYHGTVSWHYIQGTCADLIPV